MRVLSLSKVKVPVIWEVGSALKMEAAGLSEALIPICLTTTSLRTLEDESSLDKTGSWLSVRMRGRNWCIRCQATVPVLTGSE
jgi:hypothetical protein